MGVILGVRNVGYLISNWYKPEGNYAEGKEEGIRFLIANYPELILHLLY